MSRKSKICDEEKKAFARPRAWVCSAGYGPAKARNGLLDGTALFLTVSDEGEFAAVVKHSGAAEALLLGENAPVGLVTLVDLAPLEPWASLDEELSSPKLGKRLGKPVIRSLQKLTLGCHAVTLAAAGPLAPLALKLALCSERALPLERVVALDLELSPAAVNGLLTGRAAVKTPVDAVFADAAHRTKRSAALRHVFPRGCDLDRDEETYAAWGLPPAVDLAAADEAGRRLWFGRLEAEMSRVTKQYELEVDDVTAAVVASVAAPSLPPPAGVGSQPPRAGALVARGNRCVLCRSADWKGMRIPAVESEAPGEPAEGLRAFAARCDVDPDDVVPLAHVPPLALYHEGITTVHFFEARHPPPDGPLEDADLSDEDDAYDWYTFDRACLRVDEPTRLFLATATSVLAAAHAAGLVQRKWGGVFGACHPLVADEVPPAPKPVSADVKLPVTVLSGFLGAGKTTLMTHVLREQDELRVAVIVNDMASVNVDGALLRAADVVAAEEHMIELTNGCVCCTLREDLLTTLRQLAERREFDCVLVESSGISEPLPVAETFTFEDGDGVSLSQVCELDAMVTVVDCSTFGAELASLDKLVDRAWQADERDVERTVAHLLVDQVEFADVVVLNKCDLLAPSALDDLERLVVSMNPQAQILRAVRSKVPPAHILRTGKFAMHRAQQNPMWLKEARHGEHTPETLEYDVSSLVFRNPAPLHPGRLRAQLDAWAADSVVLRAKGIAYLATPRGWDHQCVLSLAGRAASLVPGALWWATIDRAEWPAGLAQAIAPLWNVRQGDRQNELVVIGRGMDHSRVTAALEACLLAPDELERPWASFEDPFLADWLALEAAAMVEDQSHEHRHEHSHD